MKTKKDYVPQYSLSIKYLRKIMRPREFNNLLTAYVQYKKENWGEGYRAKNK